MALVTPDGAVRQVADGVAFPNGIAITPDGATLMLAESYGNRLTALDIAPGGGLSGRRVWADLGDGVPDGSAATPRARSGTPTSPTSAASASREGGEVLRPVDARPRLLRLHARRRRRPDPVRRRVGVARADAGRGDGRDRAGAHAAGAGRARGAALAGTGCGADHTQGACPRAGFAAKLLIKRKPRWPPLPRSRMRAKPAAAPAGSDPLVS